MIKQILLTNLALLISTFLFSQGQLKNGSFDNWTTNIHGDGYPSSWSNSNSEYGVFFPGSTFISKSSDATNLSNSVKITSSTIEGETNFGFILLGEIKNDGPSGGVPFSTAVDSLVFDAKFELLNTDTANVLLIFKLSGVALDMNLFQLSGTQSEWRRYTYPVNALNLPHDSLILGFTSGDIENEMSTEGSWLMVDNIRFKDANTVVTGIPNPSFEDWTTFTSETPNDWYSFNEYTSRSNFSSVNKTTDAHEGSFAIELRPDTLRYRENNDFIESVLIYGDLNLETFETSGKPFVASPNNLTGMYKWVPNGVDTATIDIAFTYLGAYVGFGSLEIINSQTEYTSFEVPLTLGDTPDSVLIMINGGKAGSVLTLDNLEFNGGNVGVKGLELSESTSSIYPNPTSNDTHLRIGLTQVSSLEYTVVNALGQFITTNQVGQKAAGVHSLMINSSTYKPGVYFVKVKIDKKETTHKLIVR